MILFKKALLLISVIIIFLTLNSHYHIDIKDHHHEHDGIHMSMSQSLEHMSLHLAEHIDAQKSIGIIGSLVVLLLLLSCKNLFFSFIVHNNRIPSLAKTTFYNNVFVDPPTTLLRSILFHAPPR